MNKKIKLILNNKFVKKNSRYFIPLIYYFLYFFYFKKITNIKKNIHHKNLLMNKNINNLIIADSYHAFGDFIIFLSIFDYIDNSNLSYTIIVNQIYKEIIEKRKYKNLKFIFFSNDIGHHYDKWLEKKELIQKLISLNKEIMEKVDNYYSNVYILSYHLNIEHLTILKSFSYTDCYFLSKINSDFDTYTSDYISIFESIIFWPYKFLYIYFLKSWKKYNFRIFRKFDVGDHFIQRCLKMLDIEYISKSMHKSISFKKNSLSNVIKNINIIMTLSSSQKRKNLEIIFLSNFLNEFQKEIKTNLKINVVGNTTVDLENLNKIKKITQNNNIVFFNNINKTSCWEVMELVKETDLVITNDTFLLHAGFYYDKKTIAFINSKDPSYNEMRNFWFNYKSNKILLNILDETLFSEKFCFDFYYNNFEKIFDIAKKSVNFILND